MGVHSDLPDNDAERRVARALTEASNGRWELWFNLQRDTPEIDDLVLAPRLGSFVIEVKGWSLRSVTEYTDERVSVGSTQHRHPLKQAQIAMHGLMSLLDDRRVGKPYFVATAAFPNISRSEFIVACGEEFADQFRSMIFMEDLANRSKLEDRLRFVFEHPPLARAKRRQPPTESQIAGVSAALNRAVSLRHKPDPLVARAVRRILAAPTNASDPQQAPARNAQERRERLQVPGASIRNGVSRVVFHGKAGTGKTTELITIALAHATAGQQTLVCCYNKVLASELRSRLATHPSYASVADSILIINVDGLNREDSEDAVGFSGFQTICVDEAQDVSQENFDALVRLAAPGAEWFLADSPEQVLYGTRSQFVITAVESAKKNGTWETKRVNRRSGIAERLVCDAVLELAPSMDGVRSWVDQYPIAVPPADETTTQAGFDLGLEPEASGRLPSLELLPRDSWRERVDGYARVIAEERDRAVRGGQDFDLAIISVKRHAEWKKVKAALARLQLPYLDQVDVANRRQSRRSARYACRPCTRCEGSTRTESSCLMSSRSNHLPSTVRRSSTSVFHGRGSEPGFYCGPALQRRIRIDVSSRCWTRSTGARWQRTDWSVRSSWRNTPVDDGAGVGDR